LAHAQRLNPHIDMIYAAQARLHVFDTDYWGFGLAALDRGIADIPDSALLLSERTAVLEHLGRMEEAVENAHSAVQLNPLSPSLSDDYISALAYAGRYDSAERELAAAERIWPDSSVLTQTRYRLQLRYGDAAAAERLIKQEGDTFGFADDPTTEAFAAARVSPTAENRAKAVAAFEQAFSRDPDYIFGLVQALGTFGRVDEAFSAIQRTPDLELFYGSDVLFRPDMRPILRDPRFMAVAARLGFIRVWRRTGMWPDFCNDPQLRYHCQAEAAKYSS
jgi:tetratricopeptide (TPR) repeat protein